MTDRPGLPWRKLLGNEASESPDKAKRYDTRLRLLRTLPTALFTGEREAILPREELERALEPFRSELPAQDYVFLVRFLAKGLAIGRRELGWKVSVPADLVTIPREAARFTPNSFVELKRLRHIEEILVSSLTLTDLSPRLMLGRLLLSAIIYGGLLQGQWLEPLLVALENRVRARGTLIWIELERVWQYLRLAPDEDGVSQKVKDKEIIIRRRWFADPLSRLLIIQWLRLPAEERTLQQQLPNAFDLVKQFLRHAGLPQAELPRTSDVLFAMAGTRLNLSVPPFLAAYAEGTINAVSIPPATWTRLCSRKPVPQVLPYPGLENDDVVPGRQSWRTIAYASAPATPGEQRQFLKEMRKLVAKRGGTRHGKAAIRRKLAELVSRHGDAMCQLLHLVADWMDYNLAPKKDNAPSTVDRYLGAIADALLVVCGIQEIVEWEATEFQACYEQALALVSQREDNGYARQTFGRFHQFLVRRYGVPYLTPVFFARRAGPAESTVDANLLSPVEFDMVKVALGWNDTDRPRSATAALIAAILGFRCGLRREEIQFLRLRDIQGRHKPELVLRATPQRSLKTASSTRRLPLHVLLTPEELTFLGIWLDHFRDPDWNTLLLGISGNPTVPLPDVVLFRPIRIAMVQVTEDVTLRFHHLRHSFATWLLLRLTGDLQGLRQAAQFFLHPEFLEFRIEELRRVLLGNEYLGRKGAYAVAALCGHADLETTFTSYVHLCDLLLHRELSRPEAVPSLDADTVMFLTGRSRATVFRALQTNSESGAREWNWDNLLGNMDELFTSHADPLLATVRSRQKLGVPFAAEPAEAPWWETVQRVLTLRQVRGNTVDVICSKLRIDEKAVLTWLDRAAWIGSMRGRINGQTGRYYRHLEIAKDDGERFPPGVKRTRDERIRKRVRNGVFPQLPIHIADHELACRILNTFDKMNETGKSEVINLALQFVTTFSIQSGMLYFRQPAKARKYVDAIRLLGLRGSNIQLVDCRHNSRDKKETRARRAHWEKQLNLSHPIWKINNKAWGRADGVGTVGVQVVSEVKGGRRASYGFRYALYLVMIAWGPESGKMREERLSRIDSFQAYLSEIYLNKITGMPLKEKVVQDAVARCRRIERCLDIDLDDAASGGAGIHELLNLIESQALKFEFDGDVRKGVANLKDAAMRYCDFLEWEGS